MRTIPALRHDPEAEEAELRAYLGDSYARDRLEHYQEELDREAACAASEAELYRTSEAYLYNLTVFAMSATKLPYLEYLVRYLPPGARVLDYGCGIGSDGLMLLEAGYRVEFADFANPSTDYLRWRLAQRSIEAPVHDLDAKVPGAFDAAYAFDVIEHVADPFAFLHEMELRADLIEVNFLEFDAHEQELHYELPIRRLLSYAAKRRLELYRLLHDTSHLVIYRPAPAALPRRAVNLGRLAAGRVRPWIR